MAQLLISVFNPEEVRSAIVGGADIIDCEDPRPEVGMFEPRVITDVSLGKDLGWGRIWGRV